MLSTVLPIALVMILTLMLLSTSSTAMDLCLDLMENINWIQTIINVHNVIPVVIFMDCQCLAPAKTTAEAVK